MGDMLQGLTDTDVQETGNLYDTNNYSNFKPQPPKQLVVTSNKYNSSAHNNLIKCILKNIGKMLDLIDEEINDINESTTLTFEEFHDRMDIVLDQYNDNVDIYDELNVDDTELEKLFMSIMDKLELYDEDTQPKVAEPKEPEPFEFSIKSRSRRPLTQQQLARIEKERLEEEKKEFDEKNRIANEESRTRLLKSIKQMNKYHNTQIKNKNKMLAQTMHNSRTSTYEA